MGSQERRTLSAFPAPPSFYTSFTTDSVRAIGKLREEHTLVVQGVSPELEHLIPPQPPEPDQSWYVFGETRTLPTPDLPFLDLLSTPLLHPLPPTPASVVRLVRSALLAFLELAHVLASDPTPDRRFGTKWEDLRDLLLNAHRAVNLFRPWAARQYVLRSLRTQIADARGEMAAVDRLEASVNAMLLDLSKGDAAINSRDRSRIGGGEGEVSREERKGKDLVGVAHDNNDLNLARTAISGGSKIEFLEAKLGNLPTDDTKTDWPIADGCFDD